MMAKLRVYGGGKEADGIESDCCRIGVLVRLLSRLRLSTILLILLQAIRSTMCHRNCNHVLRRYLLGFSTRYYFDIDDDDYRYRITKLINLPSFVFRTVYTVPCISANVTTGFTPTFKICGST